MSEMICTLKWVSQGYVSFQTRANYGIWTLQTLWLTVSGSAAMPQEVTALFLCSEKGIKNESEYIGVIKMHRKETSEIWS